MRGDIDDRYLLGRAHGRQVHVLAVRRTERVVRPATHENPLADLPLMQIHDVPVTIAGG